MNKNSSTDVYAQREDESGYSPRGDRTLDYGGRGFTLPKVIPRVIPKTTFMFRTYGNEITVQSTSVGCATVSIIDVPVAHVPEEQDAEPFICLKKYEGVIFERCEETFWATLKENSGDYPVFEAEFDILDLPESDRSIATVGVPIVWTIGYDLRGGTRKRQYILYVRRVRSASPSEIEHFRNEINEMTDGIVWE